MTRKPQAANDEHTPSPRHGFVKRLNYVGVYEAPEIDAIVVWERDDVGRLAVAYEVPRYFYVPVDAPEGTAAQGGTPHDGERAPPKLSLSIRYDRTRAVEVVQLSRHAGPGSMKIVGEFTEAEFVVIDWREVLSEPQALWAQRVFKWIKTTRSEST